MFSRIHQILLPPRFEGNEGKTRVASQLNTITLVILASTTLYVIAYPIFTPQLIGRLFLALPLFPFLIGILALIRYDRVRLAGALLVSGLWVLLIFYAAVSGGVRATAFSGLILIVLSAGILLGWRAGFGFAALSILAGLLLVYVETKGMLPLYSVFASALVVWAAQAVYFVVAAALLYLALQNIDESLARARKELDQRKQVEEALREAETKYRLLVERLPVVVYTSELGPTGVWHYVGPQIESLLGFIPEEWVADPGLWYQQVHPDDRDRQEALEEQAYMRGEGFDAEYRMRTRDGREVWVRDTAHILPQREGAPPIVQGVIVDVTERRQAEAALRESEERFRGLSEAAFEGIMIHDKGVILAANQAFAALFGYSRPEDLIGKNGLEALLFTPESRELIWKNIRLGLSAPFEIAVLRPDGSMFPAETQGRAITFRGHPARVVAMRDITERKRAEEALRESEEKYRTVVEKANDGIAIIQNGSVKYVNPRLAEMRGETSADIVGRPFELFIHPDERSKILERYRRRLAGENAPTTYETALLCKDNTKGPVELTAGLITYQGAPAEIIIIRDISERKLAEQALQKGSAFSNAVIKNAAEGLCVCHAIPEYPYVVFTVWNDRMTEITGYTMLEINRLGWYQTMYPDPAIQKQASARMAQMRVGVDLLAEEWIVSRADREKRTLSISTTILDTGDEETHILAVMQDITERKQAEEKIRRQAVETTALYETTHDLVMERDLSKLLHTIVERATDLLKASGGGLYLCDAEQHQVRCVVSYNTLHDYTDVILKYGEGAAGLVAQTGEPLIIEDYRTWEGRAAVYEQDQPFISMLSVPMRWLDQVIGVIHILEKTIRTFAQEDLQLAALFANQAAIAVENAHLFESEQRRRQEAAAIAEIGRDISAFLQLDVVLERIATHAKNLLHVETSAVYLPELGKPLLHAIAALGPDADEIKQDPLKLGEGILGNIALQKTGEIVNDTVTDPRAIAIKGTELVPLEHLMGVPVLSENQLTGLIAVWRTGAGQEFKAADLDFLSNLAGQIAVAIENARLFEEEQKRRQEADTLREAAQRITASLDQEQAIQSILEQLAKVVPYASVSVQLLRDGYLEIVGGQGWPDPAVVLGVRFPIPGDSPNSTVVLERRPVMLGNAPGAYAAFSSPPHNFIQSWLGVPLIVRDRVIGMFAVDHRQPDFFTQADVQLVNAFAGQAAIAIENARLFEETQKRLREMEGVAQVSAALSRTLELEPLLESILQAAIHALPAAERGSILLADEEGNLHICAVWGYADPRVHAHAFPPGSGYATLSFSEQRAIVVPDVRAEARIRYNGDIPEMLMGGSAIAAPLIVKDRAIGVIAVDTPAREDAFTADDLHLLEAMSASAALAIENARLFDEARRRADEFEALYRTAVSLASQWDLSTLLDTVVTQAMALLHSPGGGIYLYDPEQNNLVVVVAKGPAMILGTHLQVGEGMAGRVWRDQQPLLVDDYQTWAGRSSKYANVPIEAVVEVPITLAGELIGVLVVYEAGESKRKYTEADARLLSLFAAQVASAVHGVRLLETLEQRVAARTRELAEANERLKELDQLKSKFVSDVSHELRTPVTNLNLYLNLLERGKPEKRADYITVLRQQATRLAQLIEDILDLSRLEAGIMQAVFEPLDLNTLTAQIVTAQRPSAEAKGLVLDFEPDENLPAIRGASNSLAQVITNLVANAVNYTRIGAVTVSTRTENDWALLQVQDTGMGIDQEDVPHVFERFYRGRRTAQSTIPGTGLGLAIVKEIIEAHAGQIEVESQPGRGSTFRVWLPAA